MLALRLRCYRTYEFFIKTKEVAILLQEIFMLRLATWLSGFIFEPMMSKKSFLSSV